jgi:hypothetical protein
MFKSNGFTFAGLGRLWTSVLPFLTHPDFLPMGLPSWGLDTWGAGPEENPWFFHKRFPNRVCQSCRFTNQDLPQNACYPSFLFQRICPPVIITCPCPYPVFPLRYSFCLLFACCVFQPRWCLSWLRKKLSAVKFVKDISGVHEIWYAVNAIRGCSKFVHSYFPQSVIKAWRKLKFVRWDYYPLRGRHYHDAIYH